MDIDYRVNKFDKEKEKRKLIIKEKKEKEKKLLEKQKEIEREEEERNERRRLEQIELALQKEIQEQEEFQRTGGIKVNLTLQSIQIDIENDKIKLPPTTLTLLNDQNAFTCGRPVMFQIKIQQGYQYCVSKITHCGVLEFTAAEGTVELPTKVYQNLFNTTENPSINISTLPPPIVELKYVILPKITLVQFQPKLNIFSQLGPIKLILEENLQQHTTLTVEDLLIVWYRGHSYEIIVKNIEPNEGLVHGGGTVIDTNIEVHLDCSEEYLKESQQQHQQNKPSQTLTSNQTSHYTSNQPSNLTTTTTAPTTTSTITLPTLPNEPSPDDSIVTFKFLFPSGGNTKRRFLLNSPIQEIFDYLRYTIYNSYSNEIGKQIQISTRQQPIRVYKEYDSNLSLQELIVNSDLVVVSSVPNRKLSEVLVVSFL